MLLCDCNTFKNYKNTFWQSYHQLFNYRFAPSSRKLLPSIVASMNFIFNSTSIGQ